MRRRCSIGSTARTPSTSPRCARCSTTAGVDYELDPTLVRGLDYYTRTIFEFDCDALGAQSEVGGGGRYDGLVEQLGGPADAGDRLGGGRRADPAGARRRGDEAAAATCSSRPPTRASATGPWRSSASCATPGCRPRPTSPVAASRASSSTPTGSARAAALILERGRAAQIRDMRSGEQEPIDPSEAVAKLRGAEA